MIIAFAGLGNMGGPMAANLAAAGHAVRGFDPRAELPTGVTRAPSIAGACDGAEVLVTMLPNGDVLRAVADEAIPALARGATFLDCSTTDVAAARDTDGRARDAGLAFLDAPVSGGATGAAAGTLTFMAGGAAEALEAVRPLLDVMGARVVHCGGAGTGQAAKICNNMILGTTMAVTCEAFALADRLGLDRATLYDVASTSSGQSWALTTYCPAPGVGPRSPADDDYRPGFAAEMMVKDMGLARDAARTAGAPVPVALEALRQYVEFVESGGRGRDFSALLTRGGADE